MDEHSKTNLHRRYWRLVGLMAAVAIAVIAGALWYMWASGTPLRLHVVLAMSLGIGFTVLLAGGLMSLLFFSARSGHDDAVHRDEDQANR